MYCDMRAETPNYNTCFELVNYLCKYTTEARLHSRFENEFMQLAPLRNPFQTDIPRLLEQEEVWRRTLDCRFGLICIYLHLGSYRKSKSISCNLSEVEK